MTRTELEVSWQITRRHLEAAKALLPSLPQEDAETGARVSSYFEFLLHNELGLTLETLIALGEANDSPIQFWRQISVAAENMGLKPALLEVFMTDYEVLPTNQQLAARAAELIYGAAREAIADRGRFTIALTGGSSPRQTYELLAHATPEQLDWAKVFVFLGDDRFVPYSSKDSNYEMCRELLLKHVPVPAEQVLPIHTDTATKEEAAELYAETLSKVLETPQSGPPPALDMILLGMGDDGHCASLFPGMPTLTVTDKWVVSSPPGTLPPPVDRVTFSFPVLNAARSVLFLVEGAKKAPAVRDILEGGAAVDVHPSAGVQPTNGKLLWLLDHTAAELLAKP